MARDSLLVLRAVRQRAVEQARQGLAACLKSETEAAAKLDALTQAMERDRSAEKAMPDACQFRQMFANRLDAVRAQRIAALASLAAERTRVSQARAVVVTERMQNEAVEQLIAEQKTACMAVADRKAQHEMDDIARAALAVRRRART